MPANDLSAIQWNSEGLVPTIAQNISGEVLMMAWMNQESLLLTLQEKRAVYWSRSRKKLWRKGEESGHIQKIVDIRLDCDGDTLLLIVEQTGAACHTGEPTCFYRHWDHGNWQNLRVD